MKPYTLKMLKEDKIDNMTVLEIQNEMHRLKIRHIIFQKKMKTIWLSFTCLAKK